MDQETQRKSLDQFFRREYHKLINYVKKNMEERFFNASPEDIIQDVAVSLYSRLNLELQVDNLTHYIYRSLKNRIIDSRRKTARNVSIESLKGTRDQNTVLQTMQEEEYPDEGYMEPDAETIFCAIETLHPDEQLIIIATELDGRSFNELSKEWDVPIGTLLSRKHRALSKLGRILKNKHNLS